MEPSPAPQKSFESTQNHDPRTEDENRLEGIEFYVQQIKETADKLVRDKTNRGDVKMLWTALRELRYAFKVLAPYDHVRKATVFGSARLPLSHPSCVQAIEFGKRLAEADWMVITGAGNGIMEAGHVGAGRDKSIGINILLPFEQAPNSTINGDPKLVHFKYFFTRKLLFVKEADAVVLFTGGFGTLDEAFEVLTLIQTGKSHLFPIVMVDVPGSDFWKHFLRFVEGVMLPAKLISPDDLYLFRVVDSVDAALKETLGFYRVYHSMRYVKGNLVLRLQKKLSDEALETIREEYKGLLKGGTFDQVAALPEEANEASVRDMPRLKFRFDRHQFGRLRKLIDFINEQ
ncbi:MAG: LOG family protein [Gemmataceae bacterium]|nr:LOG family protein [Gemmataceae bacterium]